MRIAEVCKRFDISADTLRYYERVGIIPAVGRSATGVRDYTEDDLGWVHNACCMRAAGVSVETIIEYVRLYQEGNATLEARRDLLVEAKTGIEQRIDALQEELARLNHKISCYERAVNTGVLTWDDCEQDANKSHELEHLSLRGTHMLLEKISDPRDFRSWDTEQLEALAAEIREALFSRLTRHAGHFGPNFGMVEATIALHYVFDTPADKLVWDVSHQTYPHKMLTGRAYGYLDPARFDEISGYTEPSESPYDLFITGHTSTSIATAEGLALARDSRGETHNVVAIIGDGSLSGGMALEALDEAGELNTNLIILVNDNGQSIAENHGGLYKNLRELRESRGTAKKNLFRDFGLDYMYVEKGNDLEALIAAFRAVKDIDHPVVVHIHTIKGKGYEPAETNREPWHWTAPFDRATGVRKGEGQVNPDGADVVANRVLVELTKSDPTVTILTAGVPGTMNFGPALRAELGSQFVDVGIAEQEAAAMAAGIAKGGGKPVFFTAATFLQRAYDQIFHDVAINNLPATFVIGSNSLFGMNDVTHSGMYELNALSTIPNLEILWPTSVEELEGALRWATNQSEHPVVIALSSPLEHTDPLPNDTDFAQLPYQLKGEPGTGARIAMLAVGDGLRLARGAAELIAQKTGAAPALFSAVHVAVNPDELAHLAQAYDALVTVEAGALDGGLGQKVAAELADKSIAFKAFGVSRGFYDRYKLDSFLEEQGLTPEAIADATIALLSEK